MLYYLPHEIYGLIFICWNAGRNMEEELGKAKPGTNTSGEGEGGREEGGGMNFLAEHG